VSCYSRKNEERFYYQMPYFDNGVTTYFAVWFRSFFFYFTSWCRPTQAYSDLTYLFYLFQGLPQSRRTLQNRFGYPVMCHSLHLVYPVLSLFVRFILHRYYFQFFPWYFHPLIWSSLVQSLTFLRQAPHLFLPMALQPKSGLGLLFRGHIISTGCILLVSCSNSSVVFLEAIQT
jgi:hypothetical protein